jgi:hypothetical protein
MTMLDKLLSRHCPLRYDEIRAREAENDPKALVITNIRDNRAPTVELAAATNHPPC